MVGSSLIKELKFVACLAGMTREKLIDDLWDYLDDRLSDQRRAEIDAAIKEDPSLLDILSKIRAHHEILSRTGEDVLNEEVPERLRRIVEDARSADRKKMH